MEVVNNYGDMVPKNSVLSESLLCKMRDCLKAFLGLEIVVNKYISFESVGAEGYEDENGSSV